MRCFRGGQGAHAGERRGRAAPGAALAKPKDVRVGPAAQLLDAQPRPCGQHWGDGTSHRTWRRLRGGGAG
eukprot:3491927-Alexandrium_andersonii.AAC.1